jgi:microcystin degradation protein MlrC
MKKRVGIIALNHESNSYIKSQTTVADFSQEVLLTGSAIRQQFQAAPHELGGFFAELDEAEIEAVPIFAARALPYGVLSHSTFDSLMDTLESALQKVGPLQGILVAPHGAAVSEHVQDVDGHWLSLVRESLGPHVPIIGTLDPHVNLSAAMVKACDALIAYRTNPHIDQRERGADAAKLMVRTLRGEIHPTQAASFLPLAINIECQDPRVDPWLSVFHSAAQLRSRDDVLSTSICFGFPYADVAEMGAATLVITEGNQPLAEQLSNELSQEIWTKRHGFKPELKSVDEALEFVERLNAAKQLDAPVCLLDMGDNVGGGSPADSTVLLKAIHGRKLKGAFFCLCDPVSVEHAVTAGIGARIKMSVGEKHNGCQNKPFEAVFTVVSIYPGRFEETVARHGGFTHFDQGQTAVVKLDDELTVMLTSRRVAPFSLQQLRSCGLDPASFRVLVAKGVHSPVAAYQEVCRHFVRVNTPGLTSADLSAFEYHHRRRPMFPFEEEAVWPAQQKVCGA